MKLVGLLVKIFVVAAASVALISCNTSGDSAQSLVGSSAGAFLKKSSDVASGLASTNRAAQAQSDKKESKLSIGQNVPTSKPLKKIELGSSYLNSSAKPETGFKFPDMRGSKLLVRTTAYCHKEVDSLPYGRKNAEGGLLKFTNTIRSAAADWSRFPVGTKFKIHGLPYEYVIDDYGSALVGTNTIDIYKPTVTAMNAWGVQNVGIEILEWGCFHRSREILDGRKHVKEADHVRKMLKEIETRYTGAGVNTAAVSGFFHFSSVPTEA